MNAELDFDPAELQEREALHEQHVTALAMRLRQPVREALEAEAARVMPEGWMADAELLGRLDAAHVAEHDAQNSLGPSTIHIGLQQMRHRVASVCDGEVEEHATQLAQLLLSNWFGLLEHAMQDQEAELLDLDLDALPRTASSDAVLRGCAAFALPPSSALDVLLAYRRGFPVGSTTALSPTLHLTRSADGWQVARASKPVLRT